MTETMLQCQYFVAPVASIDTIETKMAVNADLKGKIYTENLSRSPTPHVHGHTVMRQTPDGHV